MYKDFTKRWHDLYDDAHDAIHFDNKNVKISLIEDPISKVLCLSIQTDRHIFMYEEGMLTVLSEPFIMGITHGPDFEPPLDVKCSFELSDFCNISNYKGNQFSRKLKIISVDIEKINRFIDSLKLFN
jgi:hypothetical protein